MRCVSFMAFIATQGFAEGWGEGGARQRACG